MSMELKSLKASFTALETKVKQKLDKTSNSSVLIILGSLSPDVFFFSDWDKLSYRDTS